MNSSEKNAVILAAGFSSRFVPLSLEVPKGLLKVKGEILIERQIRQLKEAGIKDITVVVGYLKEQFFYLEDLFGVNIVINEDYYRYNNVSSLILVLDKLKNTYICSSDNYFERNPFTSDMAESGYYSAEFSDKKTDEYCMSCENDIITSVTVGGEHSWYMIGHVYFDEKFSQKFRKILQKAYQDEGNRRLLWEDVYIQHLNELELKIRKSYQNIYEFDSLNDLVKFDKDFLEHHSSRVLDNICSTLNCRRGDLHSFSRIKSGMTNNSFAFFVNSNQYVYRHPGRNTSYINRESEFYSMEALKAYPKTGDNSYIQMNPKEGWKISKFIEGAEELDYSNLVDVKQAITKLKSLHDLKIFSPYQFDIWEKIENYLKRFDSQELSKIKGFDELYAKCHELYNLCEEDSYPKCLCHCDSFAPNFLKHPKGMELIDWEYSGYSDPAIDLGTFLCCAEQYDIDNVNQILLLYFGRNYSIQEYRHYIAYVSIASLYWFIWALYQESTGKLVGHYLYLWHKNAKFYSNLALSLYEK